jgi:hypothetical protein
MEQDNSKSPGPLSLFSIQLLFPSLPSHSEHHERVCIGSSEDFPHQVMNLRICCQGWAAMLNSLGIEEPMLTNRTSCMVPSGGATRWTSIRKSIVTSRIRQRDSKYPSTLLRIHLCQLVWKGRREIFETKRCRKGHQMCDSECQRDGARGILVKSRGLMAGEIVF